MLNLCKSLKRPINKIISKNHTFLQYFVQTNFMPEKKQNNSDEKLTGAQALVAALEAQGVRTVFGYPGAQAIRVYDALYDSKKITHILARHEQAATHMADGFARATGVPGVVIVTSGPGATNTVTGIATAYMDSSPLVVITCNVSLDTIGTDGFQEADITGITMPVVKHSFLMKHATDIPRTVREAFHIASTGRPGPVLIDIPANLLEERIAFEYPSAVNLPSYKPTYKGNKKQIREAVCLISSASRPVFYVGGGVVISGATRVLTQISNALKIPCVYTLMGKGGVSDENPLSVGFVGMHGATYANLALTCADLIIACGVRFDARVTGNISQFAPEAKIIHIDIDPAEIDKIRKVDVPIVGDARNVLEGLAEKIAQDAPRPKTQAWLQQIDEWKQEYPLNVGLENAKSEKAKFKSNAQLSSEQLSPEYAISELSHQLDPENSIVVTEVGQHQMWAAQLISRECPRTFITSGGLGTMGFGLPAAIGAALGLSFASCATSQHGETNENHKTNEDQEKQENSETYENHESSEKQVICIAGDGSLQMNIQEAATAKANNVHVKVMLINNNCLGMVHQFQQLFYNERYSQTELDFNPDFQALASAYGWQHDRVKNPAQIKTAIEKMLNSTEPYLLEVVVSRNYNVHPMVPPTSALDSEETIL